jgi:tetratricopeptide (TPR) repeat protein
MSTQARAEALERAVALHQEGRLSEAERSYREILEEDPGNADAWHLLGLIAGSTGEQADAVALIRKAIELNPKCADYHNNLGNALLRLGHFDEAELAFHESIRLDPEVADYFGNLSRLLQQRDRWAESEASLRRALDLAPHPDYWRSLAAAMVAQGRHQEAEHAFRAVLAAQPEDAAVMAGLAEVLLAQGQTGEAARMAQTAMAVAPAQGAVFRAAGKLHAAAGRHTEAIACNDQARQFHPEDPDLALSAAESLIALGRWGAAEGALASALSLAPGSRTVRLRLAAVLMRLGRLEGAVTVLDTSAAAGDVEMLAMLGMALRNQGRFDAAGQRYRQALALNPADTNLYLGLGRVLQDACDPDAAAAAFRDALRHDPNLAEARLQLAACQRYETPGHPDIRAVDRLLASSDHDAEAGIALHFTRAKMYDDCQDYDAAWEHFVAANERRRESSGFDAELLRQQMRTMRDICAREWVESLAATGADSEAPVFIVGVPGCGAARLERMLVDHPRIGSTGAWDGIARMVAALTRDSMLAFPQCLTTLSPQSQRELAQVYLRGLRAASGGAGEGLVCVRGNANFLFLGLIRVLFPRARIVHVRRDSMDACVSRFFQPGGGSAYIATELGDLAATYNAYLGLMSWWREQGIDWFEVEYASLEKRPEKALRGVLGYLGLPWDPACLAYADHACGARGLGYWQLREPFYSGGTGHWRRYRKHLARLREQLAG